MSHNQIKAKGLKSILNTQTENNLHYSSLNLSNNNLKYDIKLDNKGNVLSYVISDNNFCLESTKNIYDVTADDVTNGSCDSVGDLNSILGREELKKGTYFTDKVLSVK